MADEAEESSAAKAKRTRKRSKAKVKQFTSRVKTGAIERKEISNLQDRYQGLDPQAVKTFNDLPLSKKTLNGLKDSNYEEPTRVQRESIILALKGLDVLGAAKTGSGKTLAFVIPVLERLYCAQWTRMDGLGALIITPTRELAYQIFETFRRVGQHHDFSAGLIIGGKDLSFERKRLHQCNIMICTPGRLLHHMDENPLMDASTLKVLVIDEADRCLDMGFQHTVNGILENLPPGRQTLLFSATQTKSVKDLARLSLTDPVYVSVDEHAQFSTPERLRQSYIVTPAQNKIDVLFSFLKSHRRKKLIVFMTCCKQVRFLHEAFKRLRCGLSVMALYGTMHQLKRMKVYEEFCERDSAILLATDIAARGLDFPAVDWVVQFDCPEDASSYIHRAGRTARYQQGGESLLVVLPSEEDMIQQLEARKIPINRIRVNPKKIMTIQPKLEAMLAKDVELKAMAQRAFVTYVKSVCLMKDKAVFDVQALDLEALARSMGLAVAPRVRFLKKRLQQQATQSKAKKEVPTEEEEAEKEAPWRRSDLQQAYCFDGSDDDDGEGALTLKRKDHALPGGDGDGDEDAPLPELTKKHKILTKEKVAKRILRKKLTANQKVAFDDDGNRIYDASREKVSQLGRSLELDAAAPDGGTGPSGIDLEQARLALQEEDKFDKELFRQRIKARHREERLKAKEGRRHRAEAGDARDDDAEDGSGDDDGGGDDGGDDDAALAEIIDALPDPDRIYGSAEADDDDDVYRGPTGPAPPKKRVALSDDDDDDDDEDDDEDSGDEEPAVAPEPPKKWKAKKPPKKKTKKPQAAAFDTGLDLVLDEELALALLSNRR